MNAKTITVGDVLSIKGFFTKRIQLGDLADADNLERRIGYKSGVLDYGWFYLELVGTTPGPKDFEFAGFSHFSGGRVEGHKYPSSNGTTDERSVEARMRKDNIDVGLLRRKTAESFTVDGCERLVKILPAVRPKADAENYWNSNLQPIPQWKLIVDKTFLVKTFFAGKRVLPAA